MRSKSLAGHEVGLARLSAKLVTLLELAYGMRIAHGLCVALPTLTQTSATYCCTNLLHFSLSDMPRANRAQGRGSIADAVAGSIADAVVTFAARRQRHWIVAPADRYCRQAARTFA
jgi:hypothetical protein